MTNKTFLLQSSAGISHSIREEADGTTWLDSTADHRLEDILDMNKAMATHNDGYTPSREMRRVASIPLWLIQKWKQEEGWDALNPHYADKLKEKLNSSDYMWLRTAPGRV